MKQILITGDRSGSGKTSITLALAALLTKKHRVQTFKVGMDYIDPSYLSAVSGRPCRNLDSFALSDVKIRDIFQYGCRGADMALVEGVRGLYEGAEALTDVGSTAAIAKTLDLPVILVVSAQSITRSSAAIVRGFQSFDPQVRIAGVILNNTRGGSHRAKATTAIEHYCGVPVIGAIPRMEEMQLAMRHLGLVPYREGSGRGDFDARIDTITEMIGQYVDLDRFVSLMKECDMPHATSPAFDSSPKRDVKVGIALDEAFNFYYADLFDILHALGAEYIPFSPIHDRLPEADGYIIGGGYPELFIRELEANTPMREALKEVSGNGVPVYAECGGLMYLAREIDWDGEWHDMVDLVPGSVRKGQIRVVSYISGTLSRDCLLGPTGSRLLGHEFHHSELVMDEKEKVEYAIKLDRGTGIEGGFDGVVENNMLASYSHLHAASYRGFPSKFLLTCTRAK